MEKVTNEASNIYTKVKGKWAKIRKKFLIDELNFPRKSHRFTAVYSRDKEYL